MVWIALLVVKTDARYGKSTPNFQTSLQLKRRGSIQRETKETLISVQLQLDGGAKGGTIDTGATTPDRFYTTFAKAGNVSLQILCRGDLHIDEHRTTEDVSIAVGKALNQALGSKAGANSMWNASCNHVAVTMDLSNRPSLDHNLEIDTEMVGEDLSAEMLEHVIESIVSNDCARGCGRRPRRVQEHRG